MKTAFAILVLFACVVCAQQRPRQEVPTAAGTGISAREGFARINTNLTTLWWTYHATNASYALSTNFLIHAWTGTTIRGTNTIPPASIGSPTNIVHFIIKDEGGNASATNIVYQLTTGDRIEGASTVDFALGTDWQVVRIYSRGGTNWWRW